MKDYFFHHSKKRRGINQIIGTMMMVAIVAALGSVLMFQGLNGIQSFNEFLASFIGLQSDSAREELIIEHVRFTPDTEQVDIWVRNVGIVDATINTVTIVKIDSQNLIVQSNDLLGTIIPIKSVMQLTLTSVEGVDLTCCGSVNQQWDDPTFSTFKEYFVAVTTTEGNSAESVVTTFNT